MNHKAAHPTWAESPLCAQCNISEIHGFVALRFFTGLGVKSKINLLCCVQQLRVLFRPQYCALLTSKQNQHSAIDLNQWCHYVCHCVLLRPIFIAAAWLRPTGGRSTIFTEHAVSRRVPALRYISLYFGAHRQHYTALLLQMKDDGSSLETRRVIDKGCVLSFPKCPVRKLCTLLARIYEISYGNPGNATM